MKKSIEMNDHMKTPKIGDSAPTFEARTTGGEISFPNDYKGKWVLFFSHPADFTPICTSEFMAVAAMSEQLAKVNCAIVGLSCDTLRSHVEWLNRIKNNVAYKGMENVEVDFPIVADWSKEISNQYGLIHPEEDVSRAVRAVFIIDPNGIIRLISYYPNSIGRDMQEVYRSIIALQVSEKFKVLLPGGWQPGDDVIDPEAMEKAAMGHRDTIPKGTTEHDWFFWTRKLSKKKVMDALSIH